MPPIAAEISRTVALLGQAPLRLAEITRGVPSQRLHLRSDEEPWSVGDILAHLRACSDLWGNSINAMLTQDNPTLRAVSPRSWMRKPHYRDRAFDAALAAFSEERQRLVTVLAALTEADWLRRGTFIGTSLRQREQTVLRYAGRIVSHEQPHLAQIEDLLR